MASFENHAKEPIAVITAEDEAIVVHVTTAIFNRTGEIKSVDFPEEGQEVQKGEDCVFINGDEEDIHLKAPVNGVILEINELLCEDLIKNRNKIGHMEWAFKLEPEDRDDLLQFTDD